MPLRLLLAHFLLLLSLELLLRRLLLLGPFLEGLNLLLVYEAPIIDVEVVRLFGVVLELFAVFLLPNTRNVIRIVSTLFVPLLMVGHVVLGLGWMHGLRQEAEVSLVEVAPFDIMEERVRHDLQRASSSQIYLWELLH